MPRTKVHVGAPHDSSMWRFNRLWRDDGDVLVFDSGSGSLSVCDLERQGCQIIDGWDVPSRQESWAEYSRAKLDDDFAEQTAPDVSVESLAAMF